MASAEDSDEDVEQAAFANVRIVLKSIHRLYYLGSYLKFYK